MSRMTSPSLQRHYPLATICRLWGLSRATLHRQRARAAASAPRRFRRRGPQGAASDTDLLAAIREVIAASPFTGEGYRKVWARLRFRGLRTAARRVRRLPKEHGLLAPHRPAPQAAHPHDGTVVTERVDQVWGTDMTETVTTAEGRAYVFVAVDTARASSWASTPPPAPAGGRRWIRSGKGWPGTSALDRPGVAEGLVLRHDHGSNYMSGDFQREIRFLGMTGSPAFVRQPRATAWPNGRSGH